MRINNTDRVSFYEKQMALLLGSEMSGRCFLVFILILSSFLGLQGYAADTAVVLMYHRFGEDRYPETSIKIEQFESQLELLKREGFSVVGLSDLLNSLTKGEPLPPNAVVITIDDAYRSIFEVAYPRLREYGFPFTVFVSTDAVDSRFPAYLSWDQMTEMARGGATYANHGASHISMITRLDGESDEDRINRVVEDVKKGRARLSNELRPIPNAFAYPYGEFDGKIAEELQKMGYVCFGQHSGAVGPDSDQRAIPRFAVAEAYADIDEFRIKVRSLPMPVAALTPREPVVTENPPEIEVTLGEGNIRTGELTCFVGGQGRVPIRWIEEDKRFSVVPKQALGPGRHRVNCTVPRNDGRYYWFSHPWFVESSGE
jgi:peptidoglycan/xylan/chitin deacetylase (PgdA/CDA1 family)